MTVLGRNAAKLLAAAWRTLAALRPKKMPLGRRRQERVGTLQTEARKRASSASFISGGGRPRPKPLKTRNPKDFQLPANLSAGRSLGIAVAGLIEVKDANEMNV